MFITGSEPTTIALQFHPLLSGGSLLLSPRNGVSIQGDVDVLPIGPTGEAAFLLQLDPAYHSGEIVLQADGVTTVLRVIRVSEAALVRLGNQSGGNAR